MGAGSLMAADITRIILILKNQPPNFLRLSSCEGKRGGVPRLAGDGTIGWIVLDHVLEGFLKKP